MGLTYSIPALIAAQGAAGARCRLICSADRRPEFEGRGFPVDWLSSLETAALWEMLSEADLVVFHSTYIQPHIRLARGLIRRGIPYVITPRGGLTRAAAERSKWKKRLADLLFFGSYVRNAAALHCLTEGEREASSHWHPSIFVVGNGINLPREDPVERDTDFKHLSAVYIGRLSIYHKGLDLLLEGFARFTRSLPERGVQLHLYGPDDRGAVAQLTRMIHDLDLSEYVHLHAAVYHDDKVEVLRRADLFCQVSRFEGHPMGVLEALSHGVPCMLTAGTNFMEELDAAGAGFAVDASASGIAAGFESFMQDPAGWRLMSQSARRLASRHTWEAVAEQTLSSYHACTNGTRKR